MYRYLDRYIMHTHAMIVHSNSGRMVLQPLGELVVGNVLELVQPEDIGVEGDFTDNLRNGHEGMGNLLGTLGVQCLAQCRVALALLDLHLEAVVAHSGLVLVQVLIQFYQCLLAPRGVLGLAVHGLLAGIASAADPLH